LKHPTKTNSSFTKLVGRQVKKYRLVAGLTQDDVSDTSGIYRTYLSRIEGGTANPTVLVLSAIAATLKVEVSNLVQEAPHVSDDRDICTAQNEVTSTGNSTGSASHNCIGP
jgi:transcriptional regulator with XRE-family HTH domain